MLCALWLLPKLNTYVNPLHCVWTEHGPAHPAIVELSLCLSTVKWVFPRQPLLIPQRLAATTLPPPRQPNVTSKELQNGHLSLPRQCLRNVGSRETSQRKCPKHPSQSSNTVNHINHRPTSSSIQMVSYSLKRWESDLTFLGESKEPTPPMDKSKTKARFLILQFSKYHLPIPWDIPSHGVLSNIYFNQFTKH